MDLGLEGRTAVVVGASKGIGRGIARALAAEGCNLFLLARNGAELAETARAVPGIIGTEWREGWAGNMAGDQAKDDWLGAFCGGKGIVTRRWGKVEEIGDAVAFLASNRAAYITGTRLVVDGGLTANIR